MDLEHLFDRTSRSIDSRVEDPIRIDCWGWTNENDSGVDWQTNTYYCAADVTIETFASSLSGTEQNKDDVHDHIYLTHSVNFNPINPDNFGSDPNIQLLTSQLQTPNPDPGPGKQYHAVYPAAYRLRVRYIPRQSLLYPWNLWSDPEYPAPLWPYPPHPLEDCGWQKTEVPTYVEGATSLGGVYTFPHRQPSTGSQVGLEGSNPTQTQTVTGITKSLSTTVSGNVGFFGEDFTAGVSVSLTISSSKTYNVPSVTIQDTGAFDYVDKIIHLNTDDQQQGKLSVTFEELFSIIDDRQGPPQGKRQNNIDDAISTRVFEIQIFAAVDVDGTLSWEPRDWNRKRYFVRVPAPPLPYGTDIPTQILWSAFLAQRA